MSQEPKNTPQRDRDYGTAGNIYYKQMLLYASVRLETLGNTSEQFGKKMLDQIEHPKIAGIFPMPEWLLKMEEYDPAPAREGLDDAFLQKGLPAPSSKRVR